MRLAVSLLCAVASLSIGASAASAAPGDLLYQDCLTGDTAVGPGGSNACATITTAMGTAGDNAGLNVAFAVALSPDGSSLYALSQGDDAIVRFSRNTSTGVLTFQDCITGETASGSIGIGGSGACTEIPSHKVNGNNSGFDTPYGIVVSPNGASVYVTSLDDDSVLRFDRNTGTGVLTYQGCFTGELATGDDVGGNSSCTALPSDTAGGDNSGLEKVRAIAIDPNGETVYASGPADDSIARFTRDSGTGALTYVDCFTAEAQTGSTGTMACANLPGIISAGSGSGFDNPQAITVSPNGASVYVASGNDASITRFGRTAVTGVLAHQDCVSRSLGTGANCTQLSGGTATGFDSGLDNLRAVIVSPNGASLYTVAGGDASIARFSRDTGTGVLTFQDCITGESQIGPGGTNKCATQIASATLNGDQSGWAIAGSAPALAINSAGTGVYFGTLGDRSVVQMDRNTGTGALSFRRCLTSETESISAVGCAGVSPSANFGLNTALGAVNSLALSADGGSIYTAATFSDAVARFAFEGPASPIVNPPVLTPTPTPAQKTCPKGKKLKKGKCVKKKKKKKKKKRKP